MSEQLDSGPPRSFWIIGGTCLVWNLLGVMSYLGQVTMTPEALAELPEAQRALMESTPAWANGLFAIAVFGGVLGCVLLLLKKALAVPVLIVSFVAIVIQMFYWLVITNSLEVYGPGGLVMPILVIVIGALLVWYSRGAKAKGWIT